MTPSVAGVAPKARLDHLDGIRGIAAFSVMVGHIRWPSAIATLPPFHNISLWVDFFFVLSGFVIAHTYFERLSSGLPVVAFMTRRFARLYPLHLVTLFAALAYEILKWKTTGLVDVEANNAPFQHNNASSFLANLFLVQSLGTFPNVTWNGPSWSISVEFFTYLLFAVLVAVTRGRRPVFWLLLTLLQTVSIAILVTRTHGDFLSVETDYGFYRCVLGFGMGVVISQFHANTTRTPDASGSVRNRRAHDGLKAVLACAILLLIAMPTYKTAWTLFAPFLFAAFIWLLVRYRGGVFEKLLLSRPCQFLGALSYSIYMVHSVFRGGLRNVWRLGQHHEFFHSGVGRILLNEGLTLFYIGLVLWVSWLCYQVIELPAQRWLNQRFERPRDRQPARSEREPVRA